MSTLSMTCCCLDDSTPLGLASSPPSSAVLASGVCLVCQGRVSLSMVFGISCCIHTRGQSPVGHVHSQGLPMSHGLLCTLYQGNHSLLCIQKRQQRRATWHASRATAGRAKEGHAVITKQTQHLVRHCSKATDRAGHDGATSAAPSHTRAFWVCSRGCGTPATPCRGGCAAPATPHVKWGVCPTPTSPLCACTPTTISACPTSIARYARQV